MSILRSSMDRRGIGERSDAVLQRLCPAMTSLFVLAMRLRTRALLTPRKAKPRNSSLKRREAERREAHHRAASHSDAARVLSPFPLAEDRGRRDLMERARPPFGAPPRHPRFFRPRLGSGRASWNPRMQTGGPPPAPVRRAPRGPTRA